MESKARGGRRFWPSFTGTAPRSRARVLRGVAAMITAGALVLAGLPAPARAQEAPVPVDMVVLGEQLFAAVLRIRDGGNQGVADLLLSAELLEWRKQHPGASAAEMTSHFEWRRDALDDALAAQDRALPEPEFAVRTVTALLASEPGTAASAEHIRFPARRRRGRIGGRLRHPRGPRLGRAAHRPLAAEQGRRGDGPGAEVRRTAQTDAGFAGAWNTVIGAPVGVDATAPLETMKQDDHLTGYLDVDALLAREGSSDDLVAEARRQYEQAATGLATQSAEARERLRKETEKCPADKDTKCTKEQQEAAKKAAEEAKKTIDRLGTAAKVLGKLAGMYDRQVGETLTKAATAWVSAIEAVNKYMTAVAGRGAKDAIFSFATLAMAGSLFGVATTLIGLFSGGGGGGPSTTSSSSSR